jgi:WD repeat-containing protein 35
MSVGLCNESVIAFLKAGDAKAAIDCCVLLNQWDQAVELAEQHSHTQIEGLLTRYASHLLIKNKLFQAVELYRKANRHVDAAKLLAQLGEIAGRTKVDPLRAKKLYVLAALEVDRYKRKMLDTHFGAPGTTMSAHATTAATLASLTEFDAVSGMYHHIWQCMAWLF